MDDNISIKAKYWENFLVEPKVAFDNNLLAILKTPLSITIVYMQLRNPLKTTDLLEPNSMLK